MRKNHDYRAKSLQYLLFAPILLSMPFGSPHSLFFTSHLIECKMLSSLCGALFLGQFPKPKPNVISLVLERGQKWNKSTEWANWAWFTTTYLGHYAELVCSQIKAPKKRIQGKYNNKYIITYILQ